MNKIDNNHQTAIIMLHEIYGINPFIKTLAAEYQQEGFAVYCPNLLKRAAFSYAEAQSAYDYFNREVGFACYQTIVAQLRQLKQTYRQVFIMGFSVGATIAWRCSETPWCDGIIGCYGSRIRDYLELQPVCPVLLLFAEQDSFDVPAVVGQISEKTRVQVYQFQARHGYLDHGSAFYDEEQSQKSKMKIQEFLNNIQNASDEGFVKP